MQQLIFADEQFIIAESSEIQLAGYLILTLKQPCMLLSDLDAKTAASFGSTMRAITAVITKVINPQRIYTLSFGEINPQLHFHLFPRTEYLLEQYQANSKDISGPLLFAWALKNYRPYPDENKKILHVREAIIATLSESY